MEKLKISMVSQYGKPMNDHPTLTSNVTGDQQFCAYSHCLGECGFPALFVRIFYKGETGVEREWLECSHAPKDEAGRFYVDYKAHGVMTACGPVWQRKAWKGPRVFVPSEHATEKILEMMWW